MSEETVEIPIKLLDAVVHTSGYMARFNEYNRRMPTVKHAWLALEHDLARHCMGYRRYTTRQSFCNARRIYLKGRKKII